MAQLLTLGQQIILARNGALAAGYQDPRQSEQDLESKDIRAAAQLTLFSESTKSTIRKQIASNGAAGSIASDVFSVKLLSSTIAWKILNEDILVVNAVPSRALSVWTELLAWFHAEGLQLSVLTNRSDDSVRSFYEFEVRTAVQF
jgi:phosphoglycolate phosphatase-like HAD superfamily hydrolase